MLATGVSLSAHFWDDKTQQILPECPNCDELQYKLREQIRAYDKKIRRLEALDIPITFENLLERASNCHRITIQEVFTSEIKRLEALGKINSDNAENGKVCPLKITR